MFYVLLAADGSVDRYPYTLTDLRFANPGTSFAKQISDETAASFNCFPVAPTMPPAEDHTINLERTAVKQGKTWVEEWISTPATPEQIAERTAAKSNDVRAERNRRLDATDWRVTYEVEKASQDGLGVQFPQNWAIYRQALRDLPNQPGFPWNINWPVIPDIS